MAHKTFTLLPTVNDFEECNLRVTSKVKLTPNSDNPLWMMWQIAKTGLVHVAIMPLTALYLGVVPTCSDLLWLLPITVAFIGFGKESGERSRNTGEPQASRYSCDREPDSGGTAKEYRDQSWFEPVF